MEYKKYSYILVLILMLVMGMNKTYADSEKNCYYISGDDNLKISLSIGYNYESQPIWNWRKKYSTATVWQTVKGKEPISTYDVTNWFDNSVFGNQVVGARYQNQTEANNDSNPSCPKYLMYTECPGFIGIGTSEKVYAIDSLQLANDVNKIASAECSYSRYASNYKDGKQITEDMFFADFVTSGLIEYDENKKEYTCADMDVLFGSKNDPERVRYLINQVLGYVRIIVPILIILLGTVDFAKAVLAGKEDNMKKAQSAFIKRLIAGVVVFLVPTLVDIIMGLADIVWAGEYIHCDF